MNIIVFEEHEWGAAVPLGDERARHIVEILKPEIGQTVRVALLNIGVGTAVFSGIVGQEMALDFPPRDALLRTAPPLPITVVLGQPRPPVMQRILKDLNALGVARVYVVASDLSEKSYMDSRLWKPAAEARGQPAFRRFLLQGAQQGGHPFLTSVARFYGLKAALSDLGKAGPLTERLLLDLVPGAESLLLRAAAIQREQHKSGHAEKHIMLAIGPERGWTDAERVLLKDSGFVPFSLGSSILRTETACSLSCGVLSMALQGSVATYTDA